MRLERLLAGLAVTAVFAAAATSCSGARPPERRHRRGPVRLARAGRRAAAARLQDGRRALQLLARARERRHEAHDADDPRVGRPLGQRQQHDAGDLSRERHARERVAARRHQDQGGRADAAVRAALPRAPRRDRPVRRAALRPAHELRVSRRAALALGAVHQGVRQPAARRRG